MGGGGGINPYLFPPAFLLLLLLFGGKSTTTIFMSDSISPSFLYPRQCHVVRCRGWWMRMTSGGMRKHGRLLCSTSTTAHFEQRTTRYYFPGAYLLHLASHIPRTFARAHWLTGSTSPSAPRGSGVTVTVFAGKSNAKVRPFVLLQIITLSVAVVNKKQNSGCHFHFSGQTDCDRAKGVPALVLSSICITGNRNRCGGHISHTHWKNHGTTVKESFRGERNETRKSRRGFEDFAYFSNYDLHRRGFQFNSE